MSRVPAKLAMAERAPEKKLQVARTPAYDPSRLIVSQSRKSPPKKAQVVPVPVRDSSLPVAIEPKVLPPTGIEVVHIPASIQSEIRIFYLPTIEVDGRDAPNTYTTETEQRLKQVPNVPEYSKSFNWKCRSLYETFIQGNGFPEEYKGIYFVYKCIKADAGLRINEHLKDIPLVRAYGDVFVFRLKSPGYSKSGKAKFGTFGPGFVKDYYRHGVAKGILSSLAMIIDQKEKEEGSEGWKELWRM